MAEIIYQDSERTISRDGGRLILAGMRGEKQIDLGGIEIRSLKVEERKALVEAGRDPKGWYALGVKVNGSLGGAPLAVCPEPTRAPIERAILDYWCEIEARRNDLANRERQRIEGLYSRAHWAYNDGDWSLHHQLMAAAVEAMAAWKTEYPEAAAREYREMLLAEADRQEGLAVGALVYDCDGSLTREVREERAAEFRAKATALRTQAENA